jgi:TldD protein
MSLSNLNRREFIGLTAAGAAGGLIAACRAPAPVVKPPPAEPAPSPLDAFEVTEATVRRVIARALRSGGDYCDLNFERIRTNVLGLEDHAVNRGYTNQDLGVGVRVVRGLETGYAYTESLDESSMLEAAGVAAAVATGGPAGKEPGAFRVEKLPSHYPVKVQWPDVPTGDKVKVLMKLHDLVAKKDGRIKKVNIFYRDEDRQVLVVDSDGRVALDRQPMIVSYVSCLAEDKGRRESNYHALASRSDLSYLGDERLRLAADEAARKTLVLFESVPGPVGELPVVLAPGGSGILLHEAIGHGMEADFARKKITIYADRIGKRIAPEHVTIVDDGTNPGMRGSINVDDEGNDSERTVLVERGILRTFLHDRISAGHLKAAATGSGRRQSFRHMPLPRMRNTYMLAGPHSPEEIIRSVKRGIYAEHFTNGQVLIGAGDFTFYVKNGYLIEDGKLGRPIKDVNIIGNGPKVLERVTMVGTDRKLDEGGWTCGKRGQRVPVGLGLPTVKVAAITVGGTEKKKAPKRAPRKRKG